MKHFFVMQHSRKGPRPLYQHILTAQILWGRDPDFAQKINALGQSFVRYAHYNFSYDYRDGKEKLWQKKDCALIGSKDLLSDRGKKIVLLLPSLINGAGIFDLAPQHSFYTYLIQQGFCPVIFDWGASTISKADEILEQLSRDYVGAAITFLGQQRSEMPVVLGYCLGGVMSVLAQQALQEGGETSRSRLILLATPWDFSKESQITKGWAQNLYQISLKQHGIVPPDIMPSYFASLDPSYTLQKYLEFNAAQRLDAEIFVAVEDWANAVQLLGWDILRDILERFYINNTLSDMRLHEDIQNNCQTLIVVAKKDRIVASESALGAKKAFVKSELLQPDLGHVGLMASRRAPQALWQDLADWIKNAD